MVKILLLTPFKEVYRDIATYTLNEYGKTTLRKFTEEFTNITRRLADYPTSSPEEPLLKNYHIDTEVSYLEKTLKSSIDTKKRQRLFCLLTFGICECQHKTL